VTLHRPSNVDDATTLAGIVAALGRVGEELDLVFPVHPRTRAQLGRLEVSPRIRLVEPQGYLDFIALQAGARFVITDSGGIQEETTMLGVPCLTARHSTERPITVTEGSNEVVGTDPARIEAAARALLGAPIRSYPKPALWDGKAAERIADVVAAGPPVRRPTDR
jgi:UDP-N-acetylglucosamine 2-epimerase (non-hydrolysing)